MYFVIAISNEYATSRKRAKKKAQNRKQNKNTVCTYQLYSFSQLLSK